MSLKITIEQLKSYFKTGKKPTESNFAELIDNCYNDPKLSFNPKTLELSIMTTNGENTHTVDMKGIAPYSTRSWIHGHSIIPDPSCQIRSTSINGNCKEIVAEVIRRTANEQSKGKTLVLDGSTVNTYHVAIPTPLMNENTRFSNLFIDIEQRSNSAQKRLSSGADIEIHVGARIKGITIYNGQNSSIELSSIAFSEGIQKIPLKNNLVTRAVSVSIAIEYYFQAYSKDLVKGDLLSEITIDHEYLRTKFYGVGCEFIIS